MPNQSYGKRRGGKSKMKLYRVEVVKVAYVLAEDGREAELDGQSFASDEEPADVVVDEVTNLDNVEGDWKDSLPYGGSEDLTIRQWFEKPEEPKPYDHPDQMKFNFGDGNASSKPV